jgi:SAM-dependent methyltransferase
MDSVSPSRDNDTAAAFAYSWNTLPSGSVYSASQVIDWIAPLESEDFAGKHVLELGCGNGSILVHLASFGPASLRGVDLGASVDAARRNLAEGARCPWKVEQGDLCSWQGEPADIVLCIGVLHHLADPYAGFRAVVRATRSGGRFHCWVYGWEGNLWIRLLLEPLRRIVSRTPPVLNKFLVALPLAVPFFLYAKIVSLCGLRWAPLARYMEWIAPSRFRFFWHVAFDQLVTPRTVYIRRDEIEEWLKESAGELEPGSMYIQERNGNSWKFGASKK